MGWGAKKQVKIKVERLMKEAWDKNYLREAGVRVDKANLRNLSGDINEPATRYHTVKFLMERGMRVENNEWDTVRKKYKANLRSWVRASKSPKFASKKDKILEGIRKASVFGKVMGEELATQMSSIEDAKLKIWSTSDVSGGGHEDTADIAINCRMSEKEEIKRLVGVSLKAMVTNDEVKLGRFARGGGSAKGGVFRVIEYLMTGVKTEGKNFNTEEYIKANAGDMAGRADLILKCLADAEMYKAQSDDEKQRLTAEVQAATGGQKVRIGDFAYANAKYCEREGIPNEQGALQKEINEAIMALWKKKIGKSSDAAKRLLSGLEMSEADTVIYGAINIRGTKKRKPGIQTFHTTPSTLFSKLVHDETKKLTVEVSYKDTYMDFSVLHDGDPIFDVQAWIKGNGEIQFILKRQHLEKHFETENYELDYDLKLKDAA